MSFPTHITVLGAGSWGTTTASLWSRHHPTVVWAREPGQAEEINTVHTNRAFLGDRSLFPALRATGSLSEAVESADVLVFAIPSQWFRSVAEEVEAFLRPWVPVVSLAKGLERGTAYRMTEVLAEVLPGHPAGILAGPNLAREVLDGLAAAAVLAMPDEPVAVALQDVFRTTTYRVYTSTDVTGVEICGALKNVYAIAAGMAAGFETGENTRALIVTRCLAELSRLGVALGGRPETFAGLAGLGDLLATCNSPLSRNRHVGVELARGRTLDEITGSMNQVAEGVTTTPVVLELAQRCGVEVPIAVEVYGILYEARAPEDSFRGLLRTRPTTEAAAL
jgi:glycerol-3-phosphate dehydrogenase (NAD(P)+)